MKPKKKTVQTHKKAEKKHPPIKPLLLIDKTTATTKQKTNTTIEDHLQIAEFRHTIRTNKNVTPRDNCQQKLKDKDMSPFSSSGGQSTSPKYRKINSPRSQNEKKITTKSNLLLDKPCEKIKTEFSKKEGKAKSKMTREQFNQTNYQNLLLRKMNQKKITQMSDQSSSSIPKISRLKLNIANHQIKPKQIASNKQILLQLKLKIEDKYKKQFPNFRRNELKFLCSIVLIQRLWRQNRIKTLINTYISPRELNKKKLSNQMKEKSALGLDLILTEQTLEIIRKYHQVNNFSSQKGSLDLSSELTSQKHTKMVKFVQCLRDISFHKPKRHEQKSKINIFTLRQSLSEKCLMQTFYSKIFKGQGSKNNFQLFSPKKQDKALQRSIQLIKTMKSPEKIEIEERFETQLQQNQSVEPVSHYVSVSVQTECSYLHEKEKTQISTLKQLGLITEAVIFALLNEFSEEFHSFTSRSILRKKKKVRMPGLKVNITNIRQYLQGLTSYMLSSYDSEIVRRWGLVKPISFLKIHHEYSEEEEIEEQDQQSDIPVIPNNIFYEYQLIYEQNIFRISEEDKKYCNFLEGLIKIHNILLANCMSEILEKTRMDRVVLPWDRKLHSPYKQYSKKDLQVDLKTITDTICKYSLTRVGQFHKKLDDAQQEKKILRSISEEYRNEGSDWNGQYEYLQARMELTQAIQEIILMQAINDLIVFF